MSPPHPRWPRVVVLLHWGSLLVLVIGCGAIFWRDQVEARGLRALLLSLHRHAGLMLLLAGLLRIAARLLHRERPAVGGRGLARLAASAVHGLLYACLLAVPVLGWTLSDARGQPWQVFGTSPPALTPADEDQADALQTWHALAAWAFIGLVALHAAAALWHHWVLRDGVLSAMRWRPAPRSPE